MEANDREESHEFLGNRFGSVAPSPHGNIRYAHEPKNLTVLYRRFQDAADMAAALKVDESGARDLSG